MVKTKNGLRTTVEKKHIRGRETDEQANAVDIYCGRRIKVRRQILNMSQSALARKLGLTFQQVQKYESGANRVGFSRLYDISKILKVDMNYFVEGMDEETQKRSPMMLHLSEDGIYEQFIESEFFIKDDPMTRTESMELLRNYYRINDRMLAKHIFEIIGIVAKRIQVKTLDVF